MLSPRVRTFRIYRNLLEGVHCDTFRLGCRLPPFLDYARALHDHIRIGSLLTTAERTEALVLLLSPYKRSRQPYHQGLGVALTDSQAPTARCRSLRFQAAIRLVYGQ